MKTLILLLIALALFSCEKENFNPNGKNYRGTITLIFDDTTYTTVALRNFSDNGSGTTKIHWWDAPDVNCYTIIKGNEYVIGNVVIQSEVTCNGVKRKDEMIYKGSGRFEGDSLFECGSVKWVYNAGTPCYVEKVGRWMSRLNGV